MNEDNSEPMHLLRVEILAQDWLYRDLWNFSSQHSGGLTNYACVSGNRVPELPRTAYSIGLARKTTQKETVCKTTALPEYMLEPRQVEIKLLAGRQKVLIGLGSL